MILLIDRQTMSNYLPIKIIMIGSLISGCRYIKENENKFREFRTISGDSIFYGKYAFTEYVKGKVYQLTYSNSSNREYYLSRVEGFDN